jgi:fructose/tagatose bisphosphate aldolase
MKYKYGIGVMSKNIVDACIEYANENNKHLIFIPSRRQVDYIGGYVNHWTTEVFSKYVRDRSSNILLKRDHGGPGQGLHHDDGLTSLIHDANYFDAIHIDPWKISKSFKEGCINTRNLIDHCFDINNNIIYEVGTEESIFKYESHQLEELIEYLKKHLSVEKFDRIKFAVIQSGTSLKETKNMPPAQGIFFYHPITKTHILHNTTIYMPDRGKQPFLNNERTPLAQGFF